MCPSEHLLSTDLGVEGTLVLHTWEEPPYEHEGDYHQNDTYRDSGSAPVQEGLLSGFEYLRGVVRILLGCQLCAVNDDAMESWMP